MNETLLYSIDNNGDLKGPISVGPADHGALYYWNYLSLKYYKMTFVDMIRKDIPHMVWYLFDQEWLPLHERIILGTTLDGAVLRKNEVQYFTNAINHLKKKEKKDFFPGMTKALNKYLSLGMLGFCWQHASTGVHYWKVQDEEGDRLYNFKID